MENYFVGYWNGEELTGKYGTFVECENFINETLLNKAEYGINTIELMDLTPQVNIKDESDYERILECPINMNLDEWEAKKELKSIEIDQYNKELQAEESPF